MNVEEFSVRFKKYLTEIKQANNESVKAYLFLEYVRRIFENVNADTPKSLYPDLEHYIKSDKTILIKGRADALLGNVIIEFENDIPRKLPEATEQLQRYTAILWNNKGIVDYICMATDGITFYVYRPRSSKNTNFEINDIILDPVDSLILENEKPVTVYKWLDRYLLYRTLIPPTPEEIEKDFGSQSVLFKDSMLYLKKIWKKVANDSSAMYSEWARYLSIVYGSTVDSNELFLKHTYLATISKLMVFLYYSSDAFPTASDEILKIIKGGVFKKWGIENFLEEDFFTWIIREKIDTDGISFARNLIDALSRYDLTKINQDVLKGLYQQLVDPEDRHDLGEFYTPDWLADLIIVNTIKNPNASILDPACGSGTFLASAIRYKILKLKLSKQKKLENIVSTVFGIDVHPLAVLISKANYLMSLGELIKHKNKSFSIPVYMSDSILFPTPTIDVSQGKEIFLYPASEQNQFAIPIELFQKGIIDEGIDLIKEIAVDLANKKGLTEALIVKQLNKKLNLSEESTSIIINTIKLLTELIKSNKDTIYPFILRNIYKPSTFTNFDYVVGNPPWLTYHDIRSISRQQKLRKFFLEEYHLLDSDKDELITHMELATLFLVRCAELFLKKKGSISFVMPYSVFASDHHHNLRLGISNSIGITEIYDLAYVSPIFKLATCVIFAKKSTKTSYPIKSTLLKGKLPHKNVSLTEVKNEIADGKIKSEKKKINLVKIGKRSAWFDDKIDVCKGKEIITRESYYVNKFSEGATIVPRPFWFVEIKKHEKFGLDKNSPYLETSKRSVEMTKKQWKNVFLKGKVESSYVFSTLLSSDMVPFLHLFFRPIIIPAIKYQRSFRILNSTEIKNKGDNGLYDWVSQAEIFWNKIRGEKKETANIFDWLDFRRKITIQDPSSGYKVLFSAVGTNMCSCVVDASRLLRIPLNGKIKSNGFVADYSTIYFETKNEDEAYYLSAILNSGIVDTLVKPFQAKGLWGERNLWKKPLDFPYPQFSSSNKTHMSLSKLSRSCEEKIQKSIFSLLDEHNIVVSEIKPVQTGRLRTSVRNILQKEISKIDELVCGILTS